MTQRSAVESRALTAEEKEHLWQLDRLVPATRSRRIVGSGATSEYQVRLRTSPGFAVLREYAVGLVADGVSYREVAWELTMSPQSVRKWVATVKTAKEETP